MDWTTAYAAQARSDLDARDSLLANTSLPDCHQLHYLQMACEKLCKAHLAKSGAGPGVLATSHAFIAGPLPVIARQILRREAGRLAKDTWILSAIRKLARQIELLAPGVDAGGSVQSNCEYPWKASDGTVQVPANFNFGLDLLHQKAGATLLKIIRAAIGELLTESTAQ